MRSGTVLDPHQSARTGARVSDLLVLWQHPDTRELIPIGRFGHHGSTYSFAYTRGAADIPDFRPLPGLPDLQHRYDSDHIPAVFGQRVMGRDRPDFDGYVRALGLDPTYATPWEQIVESGGRRAGDTLQFMQLPCLIDGRALARFLVNGVRHIPEAPRTLVGRPAIRVSLDQQESALQSLTRGSTVLIEPEDGNPQDPAACLVTVDQVPVGWVPRALSASIRELAGRSLEAKVHRVGEPGSPPHVRLVLDLDVPAPPGFEFDRARRWEPIAAQ